MKNVNLKSVTLPMGASNKQNGYNMVSTLGPAFDKDISEYTIFTYDENYVDAGIELELENPNAKIEKTATADKSNLPSETIYEVTSADGTVTKEYKFNYIAQNDGKKRFSATDFVNGTDDLNDSTKYNFRADLNGSDPYFNVGALASGGKILIQDGYYENKTTRVKQTKSIIEIDISGGPETISGGILRFVSTRAQSTNNNYTLSPFKLNVCKIDSSIYNVTDIKTIPLENVGSYFGDVLN